MRKIIKKKCCRPISLGDIFKKQECIEQGLGMLMKAIKKMEGRLMSVIGDFVEKQKEFNTRIGTAIDGLVGDIKSLNDKIAALPSGTTDEEKAQLEELKAAGEELAGRAEALDAQTPPVPPVA